MFATQKSDVHMQIHSCKYAPANMIMQDVHAMRSCLSRTTEANMNIMMHNPKSDTLTSQQFAINNLQSTVCNQHFAITKLQSTICDE